MDATEELVPHDRDAAVEVLFRAEWASLRRLGFLLTDDLGLAEDLAQEAFLGLHRRWGDLDDRSSAAAYLRSSVVNGARSAHRRRALARRRPPPPDPASTAGPDAGLLLAEEHRAVLGAVRRLPRRQREVLVLRYWSGLSEAEIARTLGVSAGTVKTSAFRALATLSNRLGATDEH
ncbi:RNA polymerase sigma factor [Trujillonella endophytica]|uniref:RNA polymerase sigma-70 factor, sigma-E family n=1 Tax=Trujillonella endophytica TaxID=673521 RepID=A0A1H8UMM0_9ACTN|nr:SigE family RNA polymerase sigma factor [Trujillella endophytica]SEP04470.1 RNA polymerase sigma-70 factor, sigma-E family [Trujillella endophytica]